MLMQNLSRIYFIFLNLSLPLYNNQDNIVKVGPAIDENTGKASLKAKPIWDSKEDGGSQNCTENDAKGQSYIDISVKIRLV